MDAIRSVMVPIHREGWRFVAIFAGIRTGSGCCESWRARLSTAQGSFVFTADRGIGDMSDCVSMAIAVASRTCIGTRKIVAPLSDAGHRACARCPPERPSTTATSHSLYAAPFRLARKVIRSANDDHHTFVDDEAHSRVVGIFSAGKMCFDNVHDKPTHEAVRLHIGQSEQRNVRHQRCLVRLRRFGP